MVAPLVQFIQWFVLMLLSGAIPNGAISNTRMGTSILSSTPPVAQDIQLSVLLSKRGNSTVHKLQRRLSVAPEGLILRRVPHTSSTRGMFSAQMLCVILLAAECLVVHTSLTISRNVDELGGSTTSIVTEALKIAWRGNAYPAMLSMLFLACQLSMMSDTGSVDDPPAAVWVGMVVVTSAVSLNYLWIALLPLCVKLPAGASLSEVVGEPYEVHPTVTSLEFKAKFLGVSASLMQVLLVCFIYGGVCCVIAGMFVYTMTELRSPMAVELRCVIGLVPLHMGLQLLLWLLRMLSEVQAHTVSWLTEYLRNALAGASFAGDVLEAAPTSAALFLALRLRAWQLNSPYGPTMWWGQHCVIANTVLLYLGAVAAVYIGSTGKHTEVDSREHEHIHVTWRGGHIVGRTIFTVYYLCLVGVMVSVLMLRGPHGMNPGLPPTLMGVLGLSGLFFAVRGLRQLTRFFLVIAAALGQDLGDNLKAFYICLNSAALGVSICPALCAVFLGCWMRAILLTQLRGSPQAWVQDWIIYSAGNGKQLVSTCSGLDLVPCSSLTGFWTTRNGFQFKWWSPLPRMFVHLLGIVPSRPSTPIRSPLHG